MAKRRPKEIYERLFFDRTLLVGVVFLCVAYITRATWVGAFAESSAIVIGVAWAVRVVSTSPRRVFRLLALLMLILIWSLLAFYLGHAYGLV